jgi:ureidoglycolate hydrolase
MTDSIEELRDVIHKLHGGKATHRESVPVKEVFQGQTVWDGIVEVFDLEGHPTASRVYVWLHDTGDPAKAAQLVTVLHIHPALSPLAAVRAFIAQEFRNAQAAEA